LFNGPPHAQLVVSRNYDEEEDEADVVNKTGKHMSLHPSFFLLLLFFFLEP
jgi:hypothetical protein